MLMPTRAYYQAHDRIIRKIKYDVYYDRLTVNNERQYTKVILHRQLMVV
jgi:hypothetical protein